jgi:hypothetical protein
MATTEKHGLSWVKPGPALVPFLGDSYVLMGVVAKPAAGEVGVDAANGLFHSCSARALLNLEGQITKILSNEPMFSSNGRFQLRPSRHLFSSRSIALI